MVRDGRREGAKRLVVRDERQEGAKRLVVRDGRQEGAKRLVVRDGRQEGAMDLAILPWAGAFSYLLYPQAVQRTQLTIHPRVVNGYSRVILRAPTLAPKPISA